MSTSTLEVVELDVDLSLEVPCETTSHDHPADVRIRVRCQRCPTSFTVALCWRTYDLVTREPTEHSCHYLFLPSDITVVSVLRPR
jgi:hypothetical protein